MHSGHELIFLRNRDEGNPFGKMRAEFHKHNQLVVQSDGTIASSFDSKLRLGVTMSHGVAWDGLAKMRAEFHEKQQFKVEADGTISSKFLDDLILGVAFDPSAGFDPYSKMRNDFNDKNQWIVHDDGSISSAFKPDVFLGLRFPPSPVCALYDDERPREAQGSILQVMTHVGDVGFLHALRDSVLTGEFDAKLKHAAEAFNLGELSFTVDRSAFTLAYEASVLSMDKLTPHQVDKLLECTDQPHVHLKAPAGAGKTFVALHRILAVLTDASTKRREPAHVLFVACNLALCLFVGRWLCRRVKNTLVRASMLKRMHILFLPFEQGPQLLSLEHGRLERTPVAFARGKARQSLRVDYSLVVVDEAHHIFSKHAQSVATWMPTPPRPNAELILLSDVSQSTAAGIRYPKGDERTVLLTEVVRSSQRIVAGAGAFQLAVDEATSHHAAQGPPLKAYVFNAKNQDDTQRFGQYARYVVEAIAHTLETIGNISLHDRIAIVVPDPAFASKLRPLLDAALFERYPQRNFELIDAMEAAASAVSSQGSSSRRLLLS